MAVLTSDNKGKGTAESVVNNVSKKAQTRRKSKESKHNYKHENMNHPKESSTTLTNIEDTFSDRKDDGNEISNYSQVSDNAKSKTYGTSCPEV